LRTVKASSLNDEGAVPNLQRPEHADIPYSVDERAFISEVVFPRLNGIKDDRIAEKLAEDFWNLCALEIDRLKILDTKANALLGLSSIAAAVVSVGTIGSSSQLLTWLRCGSIALFITTVVLCLVALVGRIYAAFVDEEIFSSIDSNKVRKDQRHHFTSKKQYLCFLNETILQRWVVLRRRSAKNDSKARWLLAGQIAAVLSVLSLFAVVVVALRK
jgi:hypothetical protein